MGSVCEICGDIGFEEALVDCDTCSLGTIHRYCINIVPVPIEGYITWFCANCAASDNDQQADNLTHSAEASSGSQVTKGTGSSNVPEDNVSSTRNSDEEAHSGDSNMIQTLVVTEFNSLALNNCEARPIMTPIWRGSVSLKTGNIRRIDGLAAYLSILVCPRVNDIARSLHTRFSAELYPRLDIWPKRFSKNGGPNDENIALYIFPSTGSNVSASEFEQGEGRVVDPQKYFDLLLLEMSTNDLALRCILDDAELLLFSSYMLPFNYWSLRSNESEYLWGVFRSKKTDQQ